MRLNPFRREDPLARLERDLGRAFPLVRRATLAEIAAARLGIGDQDSTSWAPTVYGTYYAQSVPVYAAIRMRSEAVAEAPIQVMRRVADGDAEPVDEQDPWQQLFRKMNPYWTQADVLTATEAYLMIWGAAYWFVEKSGNRPIAIWPLRPDRVRVIPGKAVGIGGENYLAGFAYRGPAGKEVPLLRDEIVWFRKFNPLDEFAGLSPLAPARLQFDSGKDATLYNRLFFSNGAHPDILFTVSDPLTDEQREAFLKAFAKRYQGVNKAYGALLWSTHLGPKPERMGLTHTEMQFLEQLKWTVDDASRVIDVPREMLGSGDITFANREMAERHFYRGTITREWTYLANEINEMLMPTLRAPEDYFVRFDTSQVRALTDAMRERETALLAQVEAGAFTINEYRQEIGRDPLPWGDVWWAPTYRFPVTSEDTPPLFPATPAPPEDSKWYEQFGEQSVKALIQRERRFETAQRSLFTEQQDAVLAAVKREEGKSLTGFEVKQVPPFDRIFNPTEWIQIFSRRGRPLMGVALTLAAREQANTFKLPPFNPDDPITQKWLDERVEFWASHVNEETGKLLRSEITEAAANGEGIFDVQQRVQKVFKFSTEFRAERIARTEMLAASSKGHIELYRQSGVVEAKRWLCVAGDTRVSGPNVSFAARRLYRGEMVALTTAMGRVLAITADHPILTRRGWVPAKLLHEGDDLVCHIREVERAAPSIRPAVAVLNSAHADRVVPYVKNVPPQIAQAFHAAHCVSASRGMVRRVVNLDGKGRQSEVDVVSVHRVLRDELQPTRDQALQQALLKLSDLDFVELLANSHRMGVVVGDLAPTDFVGHERIAARFGGGWLPSTAQPPSLGLTPRLNAGNTQTLVDTGPRATPADRQSPNGITGQILFGYDRCVSVKVETTIRHVYDYSTETGWMIANELVVHNSTIDDRTRPTHLAANGQIVGLNDKFQVGSDMMEAPGLGSDPAENVACRCVSSPVVRRQRSIASPNGRAKLPAHT